MAQINFSDTVEMIICRDFDSGKGFDPYEYLKRRSDLSQSILDKLRNEIKSGSLKGKDALKKRIKELRGEGGGGSGQQNPPRTQTTSSSWRPEFLNELGGSFGKAWFDKYEGLRKEYDKAKELQNLKVGDTWRRSYTDKKTGEVHEGKEEKVTQETLKEFKQRFANAEVKLREHEDTGGQDREFWEELRKQRLEELRRFGRVRDAKAAYEEATTGFRIAKEHTDSQTHQAEEKLKQTRLNIETEDEKHRQNEKRKVREEGVVGYTMGKAGKNLGAIAKGGKGLINTFGDAVDAVAEGVKDLDKRWVKVNRDEISGIRKLDRKAHEAYASGNVEKAERLQRKSDEKEETARAQKRVGMVKTAGDVVGSVKDSLSSKSRAKTLAERGVVGEKRREARIAYALGDHSFLTKLASGHSFGSRNAVTQTLGKLPGYLTYGRREAKNRKNYARQLAYGGAFSEMGTTLGLLTTSADFDEDSMTGEGWQYREYPELAKLIEDSKYEEMDAKVLESGEFSEVDGENQTPPDGLVDSESLRPMSNARELTIGRILNKNYYQVSPLEKKFQVSVARGFSEQQGNLYEQFLEEFSQNADMLRGGSL